MTSVDLSKSIVPRSDQLNAEDLLTGPRVVTITDVKRGSAEQPIDIVTEEFGTGRPYKPSKTMRRVIVAAWGPDASTYIGRKLFLYRDPDITFGKDRVGGIRISAVSHIDKRLELMLAVTKGRRAPFIIEPLKEAPAAPKPPNPTKIIEAFAALGVTVEQLELRIGADHEKWTAEDIAALAALGKSIKAGETTVYEEFETTGAAEPQQGELG